MSDQTHNACGPAQASEVPAEITTANLMDRDSLSRVKDRAAAWAERLDLLDEIQDLADELGFKTETLDTGTGLVLHVTLLSGDCSFVLSVMAFDEETFGRLVNDRSANIGEINFVEVAMIVNERVLEPVRIRLNGVYTNPAKQSVTSMMHAFLGVLAPSR